MLKFVEVELAFAGRTVLDGVSLSIYPGQKVGITGPNGAGKTTLLRLVDGRLSADRGDVSVSRGLRIGQVEQENSVDSRAAVEHVIDGDAELRQAEAAIEKAAQQGAGERLAELHAWLESVGGFVGARARRPADARLGLRAGRSGTSGDLTFGWLADAPGTRPGAYVPL